MTNANTLAVTGLVIAVLTVGLAIAGLAVAYRAYQIS